MLRRIRKYRVSCTALLQILITNYAAFFVDNYKALPRIYLKF
jgi:hypothetical protein